MSEIVSGIGEAIWVTGAVLLGAFWIFIVGYALGYEARVKECRKEYEVSLPCGKAPQPLDFEQPSFQTKMAKRKGEPFNGGL